MWLTETGCEVAIRRRNLKGGNLSETNRQTDRQNALCRGANRQTHRQTDRQAGGRAVATSKGAAFMAKIREVLLRAQYDTQWVCECALKGPVCVQTAVHRWNWLCGQLHRVWKWVCTVHYAFLLHWLTVHRGAGGSNRGPISIHSTKQYSLHHQRIHSSWKWLQKLI
jgi:hypothetical protein